MPPKVLRVAVIMIYVSLAIGVFRLTAMTLGWVGPRLPFQARWTPLFVAGAILVSLVWLTWLVGRRKNAARIVLAVLFVLGFWNASSAIEHEFHRYVWMAVLALVQGVAQLIALVMMFWPSSNRWFRESSDAVDPQ